MYRDRHKYMLEARTTEKNRISNGLHTEGWFRSGRVRRSLREPSCKEH